MIEYYQQHHFNPVPVTPDGRWFAVRWNLYERHLGISVGLLEGKQVLEFGPATGSGSAFLAQLGANLTLVEPNEEYLPQLKERFGDRAVILNRTMEQFAGCGNYDLVLAEGFLFTLDDRDAMIGKMASRLRPGGIGVFSFQDRYGGLIEMVKRLLLAKVNMAPPAVESQSDGSLARAKTLFLEDFQKLNASRPFETWWRDVLVNPFLADRYQWSYPEIVPLIEAAGCEVLGTSPRWSTRDHFRWYKDTEPLDFLEEWRQQLPFFLTGRQLSPREDSPLEDIAALIAAISAHTDGIQSTILGHIFRPIKDWCNMGDRLGWNFASDLRDIFSSVDVGSTSFLFEVYQRASTLRSLWGAPYHYISFVKQ